MAGDNGGSWWNPIDNIGAQIGNVTQKVVPTFSVSGSGQVQTQVDASKGATSGIYGSNQDQTGGGADESLGAVAPPSGGASTGGGTGGASRAPAYSQEDLAYLDSQMGSLDRQYGRTDTQLQNALAAALQNYQNTRATGETQYNRNTRDINLKEQVSEQGRGRELGKVDTNARMLANSLRQRLGLGASASSAQNVAGEAVARQASEQRGDVLGDYAANFAQIGNTRKDTEDDWSNMKNSLTNEYNQKQMDAQGEFASLRAEIEDNRKRVAGEKAKLLGGGYAGVRSAMAPYDERIKQGESLIDGLYNKYAAAYKVNPIQQRSVNLRDYATDNVAVRDQAQGGEEYSPYKNPFAKEEEQQPLGY